MSNIYNWVRSLQAVASVCPLSFTNENNRIANVCFYFVLEINFFEFNLIELNIPHVCNNCNSIFVGFCVLLCLELINVVHVIRHMNRSCLSRSND